MAEKSSSVPPRTGPAAEAPKARRRIPPDPVIEAYKKDIDRTLLRENLKLTVEERFKKHQQFAEFVTQLRGAARKRG